jgi:VIT1/CCC1 family predicted Fe2+/Mn2+ transporter
MEQRELAQMFVAMGMRAETAEAAAADIHGDDERATLVHVAQELGVDPDEKPSPWVAATSSFVTFAVGAVCPLLPYLLGFASLVAGLATGACGLLVAGALAARFTIKPWWQNALRQLAFGAIAASATYLVGMLIGVDVA